MSDTLRVKKPKKFVKVLLVLANILIIAGLGFTSVFYFLKYQDSKNNNLSPEQRTAKYEKEIAKSYTLPVGDKATLADVKSAADLKKDEANKEFFKDSADGDILLVYTTSKLGILYRPTTKKIIKAGPVTFKQQVSIAIIGAKTDREKVATAIKGAFSADATVTSLADPKIPLTGGIIIVDITGKNAELATKLATELKAKVGNMPEGQDKVSESVGVAIYVAPTAATSPALPADRL
jgi:hypothetical protein